MKKTLFIAAALGFLAQASIAVADSEFGAGEVPPGPGAEVGQHHQKGPCKNMDGETQKACRMEHRGDFFEKHPEAKADVDAFREKQRADREAFHRQMREKYGK